MQIQACGVCHTDLHYREGGINDDFPFLLGHEAAGVVEAVGEGVTDVAPGDFVILNWRAVCGQCRACAKGKPQYCFNTHNATQKMTLTDGTELSPALGIGAFAEKTLVAAGQCTKVDPEADPHGGRPARLRRHGRLRCGHQHRRRQPRRLGRRDRLRRRRQRGDRRCRAGRRHHDHRRRRRRPQARVGQGVRRHAHGQQQGAATRSRRSAPSPAASAPTSSSTRSAGPETYEQAFYARDLAGTVVLVGVPTPEMHGDAAADRDLRPRRRAEVQLVRRLPALAGLPHAGRPLPAGPVRPRARSSPRRSASTTSRPPSTRCTAARSCARS